MMVFPMPDSPTADALLDWYDHNRRELPWRAGPGETPDPYHVWLSEIMLQQTTAGTVGSYFETFKQRWPRVENLAAADLDAVLTAWAGLGYYARARNLHKCAGVVAFEFGGRFPETEKELLTLPGVGAYTAAAIAAIAFNQPAAPVDGNIERVTTRLFRLETPPSRVKTEVKARTGRLVPPERPGDFAQAMMDLGATVCTPRKPKCPVCPFRSACQAVLTGDAERFPVKAPKKPKPTRIGAVWWLEDANSRVLLRRRAETGLLGGMMEFPSSGWTDGDEDVGAQMSAVEANWRALPGVIRHTFTHFHLELSVWRGRCRRPGGELGLWTAPGEFRNHALPAVMRKVWRHVQEKGWRETRETPRAWDGA